METEEELPLPSFAALFGGGASSKKRRRSGGSSEESSGRWTPEEHRLFLEGVLQHGKDWKKMQSIIKTRSLVQIRTHAQKVFKKVEDKKTSGAIGMASEVDAAGSDGSGGESVPQLHN